MFCLVDFRNRPQLNYTFSSRDKAKKYLEKIKNNPLGVTVFYFDGRREYFENGLPNGFDATRHKVSRIEKGCHIKYKIQALKTMDCLRSPNAKKIKPASQNWKTRSSLSLFMLGNQKLYACLIVISLVAFSSSYFFQKSLGNPDLTQTSQVYASFREQVAANENRDETALLEEADSSTFQIANEEVIFSLLSKVDDKKHEDFETEIRKHIKGRPMEAMAPYIAKRDRIVAAFIVGIAMKESKFGVYAPHDSQGRDCYNYWGYRGKENTTASGYSCFDSPEHAIKVVGNKIESLTNRGISNPAEMISWKCGSTCAGHGSENVRKWIADVGINFYEINNKKDNS